MTRGLYLSPLLLIFSLLSAHGWAEEVKVPLVMTLEQAFQRSLKRSETVAISAEEMNLAQSRFYHSLDYFLPQAHFEMTRFYQDASPGASGFGNSQRPNTPEKKFTFSQPIFSGFREIAALSGSGADKRKQRYAWKRAQELLFVDVMETYYTLLQTQKDVQVLVSTHQLLAKRLKDMDERVRLGRSRPSEMKTSLSDLKIIEADLVGARALVKATKNLLKFYVGEELDGVTLEDAPMPDAGTVSADVGRAKVRADVLSLENGYIVAQKGVISANANLFPTISLDGNYYTQRVGAQAGNDWDVLLTFDVPVFEVGQTLGDIKEAAAEREQARLAFEQGRRLAVLDIQNAYEDFLSSRASEEALSDAHRASQENYVILTKEYTNNLVNNLEVLDALRRQEEIATRYNSARYGAIKDYWRLRVALGDVPGVSA